MQKGAKRLGSTASSNPSSALTTQEDLTSLCLLSGMHSTTGLAHQSASFQRRHRLLNPLNASIFPETTLTDFSILLIQVLEGSPVWQILHNFLQHFLPFRPVPVNPPGGAGTSSEPTFVWLGNSERKQGRLRRHWQVIDRRGEQKVTKCGEGKSQEFPKGRNTLCLH